MIGRHLDLNWEVEIPSLVLGRSQTVGFGCLWHSGPPLCPTAQPGAAGPHLLAGLGAMEH